jgi:signal transduction histidine kinase
MHGHVLNDEFHFYVDNRGVSLSSIPLTELSASIRFNPVSNSDHELTTGLRIAKKIVEIHEGLFLIANSDLTEATIYITLPLTRLITPPKPSLVLVTNNGGSISDELP